MLLARSSEVGSRVADQPEAPNIQDSRNRSPHRKNRTAPSYAPRARTDDIRARAAQIRQSQSPHDHSHSTEPQTAQSFS